MKKKPQTIADLNINLVFIKESLTYDYFMKEFKAKNPKLPNYKITPCEYLFDFIIIDLFGKIKNYKFKIFVSDQGIYENTLYDFMYQINDEVSTYLFDYNILGTSFKLDNFVKSTSKSNQFVINSQISL